MKFSLLTFLLAFAGLGTTLSGQSQVVISIPDVVATGLEDIICVPVIADSFPNIVSTQFSLTWDSTEVSFVEARLGDNPLGFDGMATSTPRRDQFRVGFIPSDAMGITLPSGTVMFELCYTPKNSAGFTRIGFDGELEPEFVVSGTFVPFAFDTIPGSINYGTSVAAAVLPGDTDANMQVDHRDLLNIGLLHGETGPVRNDATTDFTAQTAANWPGFLNSGINYATVDADGNGTIDATDLDAVLDNYAEENDGNFEFAPTVATPAGPALLLNFPETVDAGQETSLLVELGDGTDPDAVGYGLAFTLAFDPSQVDMSTVVVDFTDAFLGDDLLTLAQENDRANGIVEVALSRKDQINTTTPGGRIAEVRFTTIPAADDENYEMSVSVTPNAFVRSDQSTAPINGSQTEVTVMGTSAVGTPVWAQSAQVFPNPTTDVVYIRNLTDVSLDYSVYSMWGQQVLSDRFNGDSIDLEGLAGGLYLIVLTNGIERYSVTVKVAQ